MDHEQQFFEDLFLSKSRYYIDERPPSGEIRPYYECNRCGKRYNYDKE